jgi:creatinine amidohydrolase
VHETKRKRIDADLQGEKLVAGNDSNYLSGVTSKEFASFVKTGRITKAILPIGSLEQHGPHLPLSTDTIIAEHIAEQVAKRCSNTSLMPPIPLGCSSEHIGFAGTMSLQPETLMNIILDISHSLMKSKLDKVFIINGHGGNKAIVDVAVTKIKEKLPEMHVYSFTIIDIVKRKFDEIRNSDKRLVGHADEIETSLMLAIQPEVVDMSKAVREEPSLPRPLSFELEELARISFAWNSREVTKSGVIGDARPASLETGRILLGFAIETISQSINEL